MNAVKVLLGALIGVAAGAALGVLFAPERGSVTRRKLSKQGSRYLGAFKDTASEYVDTLAETFESVRETAADLTDKAKDAVEALGSHEPQKHTRRT